MKRLLLGLVVLIFLASFVSDVNAQSYSGVSGATANPVAFNSSASTSLSALASGDGIDYLALAINGSNGTVQNWDIGHVNGNGVYTKTWNGTYANGTPVPDGGYEARFGLERTSYGLIKVLGINGSNYKNFNRPSDVATDSHGNVYVLETDNNTVLKYDSNGNFIRLWGSYGYETNGSFNAPVGIAVGPSDNVYVMDTGNNRVQIFDSDGNFLNSWGSKNTGNGWSTANGSLYFPSGIAVDKDGFVYLAESGTNRIQKFDSNGTFITTWGSKGSGNGSFNAVTDVALDNDGNVYTVECYGDRVQKFDSNGNFITAWGSLGSGNGQFDGPHGIQVGPDGSIYVSEYGNNRVQKFDSNGVYLAQWGSWGSKDGQFNFPYGIAVDTNDDVYVTDVSNNRIQKFDSSGNFIYKIAAAGGENGEFHYPASIAFDANDNVYITETWNRRVQKFDSSGNYLTQWGSMGSGDGQFANPVGVAVDKNGYVYVTDASNYRVEKFDSNGNYLTQWGSLGTANGSFTNPSGIAVDSDNYVYVVDQSNNRIQKFDSNGNFITTWGNSGNGNGSFECPNGIAIDRDGHVYVAEVGLSRVQEFDSNGNYILQFGSNGSDNGSLYRPFSVAVDQRGDVYVADTYNNRVQKFDPNGNYLLQLGSYGSAEGQFNQPWGVALNSSGYVYLADSYNQQVKVFAPIVDSVYNDTGVIFDNVAPVTSIGLSGTLRGDEGYFSDVLVNLSASDSLSGVDYTLYSLDGSNWTTYSAPFLVSDNGSTTVYYYSVDNAGNAEAVESQVIKIDRTLPSIQFEAPSLTVNENDGTLTVTVTRTGAIAAVPSSVDYSTGGGNATAGVDYASSNGTLTFDIGETNKSLTVPIIDNYVYGPDRYLFINLSSPTNATLSLPDSTLAVIADNDPFLLNAAFVNSNIPGAMVSGKNYTVSITARNTGNVSWNASSQFRLGGLGDATLFGPQRYMIAPGVEVLPCQEYTWTFNMTAPAAGNYTPQYQMVWDGHQWFGETLSKTVSVRTPAPDAIVVSDCIPDVMVSGQTYNVSVTMKNTGDLSWNASSRFRLGGLGDATLFGPQRYMIAPGVEVLPGQDYTFSFIMTAPAAGNYTPQYRMACDSRQWFGSVASENVTVQS